MGDQLAEISHRTGTGEVLRWPSRRRAVGGPPERVCGAGCAGAEPTVDVVVVVVMSSWSSVVVGAVMAVVAGVVTTWPPLPVVPGLTVGAEVVDDMLLAGRVGDVVVAVLVVVDGAVVGIPVAFRFLDAAASRPRLPWPGVIRCGGGHQGEKGE